LEDTTVRTAIHALIERKEQRIKELREGNKTELRAYTRMLAEHTIECIEHAIATLIELEHNLKLCGCPPEAYQQKGVITRHDSTIPLNMPDH
jgi:hypothetical protein